LCAQSEWEEMPSHGNEILQLLNVLPDSSMIGYLEYNRELYKSDDWGLTWTLLYSLEHWEELLRFDEFDLGEYLVEGDSNGNVYIGFSEPTARIIQISPEGERMVFYENPPGVEIPDFCVLPNNQVGIVDITPIGVTTDLHLYESSGERIKTITCPGHNFEILMGRDSEHYIIISSGADNDLYKFDNNFSELTYVAPLPVGVYRLQFINGLFVTKFITNKQFSTDGINWTFFPPEIKGWILKSNGTSLYVVNEEKVYYSNDNAQSFESFEVDINLDPSNFSEIIIFPFKDDGISLAHKNNHNCDIPFFTVDEGWGTISNSLRVSKPVAHKVEALSSDRIFISEFDACANCASDFNNEIYNRWELGNDRRELGNENCFPRSLYTSSGTLLMNGRISFDEGENWNSIDTLPGVAFNDFGDGKYDEKNGSIYISPVNEFDFNYHYFKSDDLGNTWEYFDLDFPYEPDYVWYSVESLEFTVEGDFFYKYQYPPSSTEGFPYGIHISSCIPECMYAGNSRDIVAFKASKNEKLVYFITLGYSSTIFSVVSDDELIEYELDLPNDYDAEYNLVLDSFDNLIIYNEDLIWLSTDQGFSWKDITPDHQDLKSINDLDFDEDNYLYVATTGTPILRYENPINEEQGTSTDNLSKLFKVDISPNPTDGKISINFNEDIVEADYTIFNSVGKVILKGAFKTSSELDVQIDESGIYFMQVRVGKKMITKKLIIEK